MRSVALLAAVFIGFLFALQPPANTEIARRLGSPFASALLSLTVSALILLPVTFATGFRINAASLATLPWWFAVGGAIGACVVTGSTLIVPVIGAAALVACIVFGQAIGSSMADHFGLFNLAVKPVDMWKAGGLAIMLAGLLVFHFGGR